MLRFLALVSLLAASPLVAAGAKSKTIAIVIANTRSFDTDLPELRFAQLDLTRFFVALQEAAGVDSYQVVLHRDPTVSQFNQAIEQARKLAQQVKQSGDKPRLLFYFSGHSDASGLHLGDRLLSKDELHDSLARIPADLRIAFLDSCYSGALASKGIKPAQEFQIPKAEFDEPSGSVFFAATSGNEVAFEIEELKGSLFTHYLVSGMYGQADNNDDGLVTVDELYQYVYREMRLHNLMLPKGSSQKPEYNVDLHGKGALVLATPKVNAQPLVVGDDLSGELTLSAERGINVFRVIKAKGEERKIFLRPGRYRVVLREQNLIGEGLVTVDKQAAAKLRRADLVFKEIPQATLVAKGKTSEGVFDLVAGVHTGLHPYLDGGGFVEAGWRSPGIGLHATNWRFATALDFFQNEDHDDKTMGLDATVGINGSYFLKWGLSGHQIHATMYTGGGRLFADKIGAPGKEREIDPTTTKVGFGLATSLTFTNGLGTMISFKRDFVFVTDRATDDVMALAATMVGVGVYW